MNQEKANEIINMFPAGKPVCFNYQTARNIVLELLHELQAERILNVVTNQRQDDTGTVETWVNMYRVRDDIENPEKAFRAAVVEFCQSDDSVDMVKYAGGSPNWGDIQTSRPDDFLKDRTWTAISADAGDDIISSYRQRFSSLNPAAPGPLDAA